MTKVGHLDMSDIEVRRQTSRQTCWDDWNGKRRQKTSVTVLTLGGKQQIPLTDEEFEEEDWNG
jgi:hypothetical protein